MHSNKEINLGSFEKTALFYLLDVEDYLNERKGKQLEIGLGSRQLLENLFLYLKINNNFAKFQNRFLEMAKYIFADDMIIAIKNDKLMDLYFITSSQFNELLKNNLNDLLSIVNRWEGNSLRVNRDKILEKASKVSINFSFLETSFLNQFEEFEIKLSELLVRYINKPNEQQYKDLIFKNIEELLTAIDLNIKELS